MRKKALVFVLAIVLVLVTITATIHAETKDYVCKVCYFGDKRTCESFYAPDLEGVHRMVITQTEMYAQKGVDKVKISCAFPERTEYGVTGYDAEIALKK